MSDNPPFAFYGADMPPEYFSALGQMQHAFTHLEVGLTSDVGCLVMCRPVDTRDTHTVRAISAVLGGMRMAEATATIKRLFRTLNVRSEICVHMDLLCTQITEIQAFRNRLSHYGTEPIKDAAGISFTNSDIDSAREIERAKTYVFDLTAMNAATHDLLTLFGCVGEVVQTIVGPEDFRPFELPTWRYKPSMLVEQRQQSLQNPLPPLPRTEHLGRNLYARPGYSVGLS